MATNSQMAADGKLGHYPTLTLLSKFSILERAGLSGLNEGQVIEYEEVLNKGKTSAENLRVQR
jgi:hypothetical protein